MHHWITIVLICARTNQLADDKYNFIHCHNTQCINSVNMQAYDTFHVIIMYTTTTTLINAHAACNICKLWALYWVYQKNKKLIETIIIGNGNGRGWRGKGMWEGFLHIYISLYIYISLIIDVTSNLSAKECMGKCMGKKKLIKDISFYFTTHGIANITLYLLVNTFWCYGLENMGRSTFSTKFCIHGLKAIGTLLSSQSGR